ncbi:MAG: HlyD family secretion protein [Proteobacteria bacterium]|nr:HlyD family secretion protein [Pseudomonadota bacterium]
MIVFLTLCYVGLLFVLIKLNIIKLTLGWKLSPLIWMVFLLTALFIPMQFWAPAGNALVVQYSVPIVPNVAGQVTEVPVQANVNVKKGAVLFKIDPVPYIAARDQVKAQLDLANIRLKETELLRSKDAISVYELESFQAQVKQLQASLKGAEYNLKQTVVTAPSDGFVTNLALRPGARVASFPIAQAMSFVENSERIIAAQIPQSYLRFVEGGLDAEITFKLYPGKVYPAKVQYIVRASALGQIAASGQMVAPREIRAVPFAVRLKLDDQSLMNSLPAGAVGSVAIYSGSGAATHLIRKVMIRMESFVNYISPF